MEELSVEEDELWGGRTLRVTPFGRRRDTSEWSS